jgi:hypothetical protein
MNEKMMSIVDIGNNHDINNLPFFQNDNQNINQTGNTVSDIGSAEFSHFDQNNNKLALNLAEEKTYRSRAISGAINQNFLNNK